MDKKCDKSGKDSMSKPFLERELEELFEVLNEREDEWEMDDDFGDYEPGPCDDCDDRTFLVAARCCDTCNHGSYEMKQKVEPCSCNRELSDDEQYQHDMWGCPNAQ